ncbi:MAG: hypothetical protein HKN76_09670, partial [Saprospiraceae bacterium]|nr:hypothetical protein [Saprospiraceae bacterium]
NTSLVTTSDHNYDMGSLWINAEGWTVIGPTTDGPQKHGGGGEVTQWVSKDKGKSWKKKRTITQGSLLNHNYVRRVVDGEDPFRYFWADGNPDTFSQSHLYFGDKKGTVWQLPYDMSAVWQKPVKVKHK